MHGDKWLRWVQRVRWGSVIVVFGLVVAQQCQKDSDCNLSSRRGVHSLFCVAGECAQLKAPGVACKAASECASFPFFGALACTKKCKEGFCCQFVPSGAACAAERPDGVSGCVNGFVCRKGGNGAVCVPSFGKRWVLGPLLSVMGNLFINIGLNFQKRSYAVPVVDVYGVGVNVFLFGVGVYILGKVSGFSSYAFGNQSLMASLGAVGLVANSIFAPLINREVFTVYDLMAILLVLIGSSVIVSNAGGGKGGHHTVGALLEMYLSLGTLLWFAALLLVIASLWVVARVVEENSEWRMDETVPWVVLDKKFTRNGWELKYAMLFVYVGLSAGIASFTTLFAKSFGEMIALSFSGQNQFLGLGPYFFLGMIVLCTVGQIYWLNRALKRYDALLVIPVFHVLWTVTSVTTAGIYFKDFAMFTPSQFRNFVIGLVTIFSGSGFLTFRMVGKDAPSTESAQLNVETKQK
ncbi:magnesium transporter [Nematocida homosporus]|uniref:magnesium transporter n=1 Tax=Nematocida homosporus TaxID=1912981 RepID=UPI00221FA3E4|nr:magnesium transporter [Nematocida homosporus]KAI5187006.1 magnesium transporter [Nematocida homosporus]